MTHSDLPKRWRILRGRYYYNVPPHSRYQWDGKQTFKLGDTEKEAWRTWFERTGELPTDSQVIDMNYVFDSWWAEYVIPHLADGTQDSYRHYLKKLRLVFGHLPPGALKPTHVFRYKDRRRDQNGNHLTITANREAAALSSAMNHAVRKGWIEKNVIQPACTKVGPYKETPRKRSPSQEELEKFCDINPHLRGYVTLKSITGLRQGQLLAIDLTRHYDGRYLTPPTSKGGRENQYEGESLVHTINAILDNRIPRGPLFLNRNGNPVTSSGFKSSWRRAMKKFVDQGGEKFNEHDIRKYVANKASTLEHAQCLLGHQDPRITAQVYRNGPQTVQVLE